MPSSDGGWRRLSSIRTFLGAAEKRRRGAHRGAEHDAAARGDVAGFHHRPIHRAQEAIANDLRQHRKVHVDEARLPVVDRRAQGGIRLIGRAEADGVGLGQRAIERWPGGGAGEHADLKLAAGFVFGHWRAWQRPAGSPWARRPA